MPTYRCRSVKPKLLSWKDIEAESPELAANEFHNLFASDPGDFDLKVFDDRVKEEATKIGFARIEVDGHGEWISRMFYQGIHRRGGGKPLSFEQRLKRVAEAVGFEGSPMELVEDGWEGENP